MKLPEAPTGTLIPVARCFTLLLFVLAPAACGSPSSGLAESASEEAPAEQAPAHLLSNQRFTGDLDGMVKRRQVRVLTTFNSFGYYISDDGTEKGATFEVMKMFEEKLNEHFQTGKLKVYVVMVPTRHDKLLSWLVEGRGDIASANLTVTPERHELVDFAEPWAQDIQEIAVTAEGGPTLATAEDLSGVTVTVRQDSSYYASLQELNRKLEVAGKAPVDLRVVDPLLEDEDLAEMLASGLIEGALVMDQHRAEPLAKAIPGLVAHPGVVLRTGGQIASAFRKNSPQLAALFNEFVKEHKQGTLMGNILINRYFKDSQRLRNALDAEGQARFANLRPIFEKYGKQYELRYLAMMAQGYQESKLDQSVRSSAGAIGVMQLLKSTAADPSVGLPNVEDLETNIHAGIKYMRHLANTYFPDVPDDLQQALFCLAAYNAGPNRIQRLRKQAEEEGLDPDQWFGNVEAVVAREVGMEPVRYVANIFRYFNAYMLYADNLERKKQAAG